MKQSRLSEPSIGRIGEIDLTSIRIGEQKIRHDINDDDIIELAADIAQKGLLQPIGVIPTEDGYYQLLWGARRLMAHFRLKKTRILAHVYDAKNTPVKAVALVENLQRVQMDLSEEVEAIKYLVEEDGKSVEQICDLLSKSRSWVLSRMAVPGLPDCLKEPLLEGALGLGQIEVLARIADPGSQSYLASQCVINRWSVTALKQVAEPYINNPALSAAQAHGDKIFRGEIKVAEPLFTCEACGRQAPINRFVLVRVCIPTEQGGEGCLIGTAHDTPQEVTNGHRSK